MKRSAWALSLLGLVGFAAPALAQDSTKTQKTEQSSPTEKSKVERSIKTDTGSGTAKSDTSVSSETKPNTAGTTEMQTGTKKAAGSLKSDKAETKERTLKDSDGTVVDHEKKTTK